MTLEFRFKGTNDELEELLLRFESPLARLTAQLDDVKDILEGQGEQQMRTQVDLTELLAAVAEQKTVDDSVLVLVDQLATQLTTLASAPSVDPAALADLASSIRTNNAAIRSAVVANTTPAP